MRTSNPALNNKTFSNLALAGATSGSEVMTLEGTVNKTGISILLTMAAGWYSWGDPKMAALYIVFILVSLVIAIVLAFKKTLAPTLTPVYAVLQGLAMGSFSSLFERAYPGIVFQAISLTFGTLFCLVMAYKSGWIKPSENFKLGVAAATGAIFFTYLICFVLSLFHVATPFLTGSSLLSIGISAVVVVIAALNLVLDFDFIESGARRGDVPKYMEWYAAFGLLVTLIWLYVEILRLLTKLADRR